MSRRNPQFPLTVATMLAVSLLISDTGGFAAEPDPPRGFRGPAEMRQFVDGIMAGQRESLDIAGAVVVVVADGAIYFSKGYGRADIRNERPVDPETTLFRIGSVTKLFTATAMMQLWEQDKLELDQDVNLYLQAIQVPPTFPEPITPAHLLAHTAGFEDRFLGLFCHDPSNVKPLVITLDIELPERVRRPGEVSVYSNHGTALAGLLVQEVSGMLWEEYVQKNILDPLGMEHTTVWQPVSPALKPTLAIGYRHINGQFKPTPFNFVPISPAGSASASGGDMARFMIAHLESGRLQENRVLSETTVRAMQRPLFSNAPGINGLLHGFDEMNQNGERIFGHRGGMPCFYTLLALMPDHGIGVFISYNSDMGAKGHEDFWQAFLNHYFPAPVNTDLRPTTESITRIQKLTGEYSSLRRSSTTLTKLSALLWTARVSVDPDGYLLTTNCGEKPRRWIEVEPSVFQEMGGTRRMAFRTDLGGQRTYLFPDFPAMTFIRHRWYETSTFQFAAAAGPLLLLGSGLLFWPLLAWYMHDRPIIGSPPRAARLSAWFMSLLFIGFFVAVAAVIKDPSQLTFGVPVLLQRILWLPILAALFLAISAYFALRAWAKGYWSFPGRLHYSSVALAGAAILWWTWHWNLLGFHY